MSDAKRMHGLMIGQPNFAAPVKPKAVRGQDGRFVKAAAANPDAPRGVIDRLKDEDQ